MPDLIAQGADFRKRWRRPLPAGEDVVLGRGEDVVLGRGEESWEIAWDKKISHQHATIQWQGDHLQVTKYQQAANPIFYQGDEQLSFEVPIGGHFVIGETTFSVADGQLKATLHQAEPVVERSFSADDLQKLRFGDPDQRIEMISQLPDIISRAANDSELFIRMINLLLSGIPLGSGAAIVSCGGNVEASDGISISVMHWDYRGSQQGSFSPSQRLIQTSVRQNKSVLQIWKESGSSPQATFTATEGIDWAFCVPIDSPACPGWALYVAGEFSSDESSTSSSSKHSGLLEDDIKFTELAASTLGNLRQLRALEQAQAHFRQFFPTVVLDALRQRNPDDVLAPQETEVAVMFCDLHGFARESEQWADDLPRLLERTSGALGVMTRHLLASGGVVGDFHGDAVMGFWGWPLRQDDRIDRACTTAHNIHCELIDEAASGGSILGGFQAGFGIAAGKVVAGKIGSADQVKVTVFGPVVNMAARLESMTRTFGVSILLDEASDDRLRGMATRQQETSSGIQLPVVQLDKSDYFLRRVGLVLPYGMQTPAHVSQLVRCDQVDADRLGQYESLLPLLSAADWPALADRLAPLADDDPVAHFLASHIRETSPLPDDGPGTIRLRSK